MYYVTVVTIHTIHIQYIYWTSHFLKGTRNTRPFLTVHHDTLYLDIIDSTTSFHLSPNSLQVLELYSDEHILA